MNNGKSNSNSNDEKESLGLFKSIYLYGKLFLYYPFKYTLLLTLFMAAYKIWTQVLHFGKKSYENISEAFCILVECASGKERCQMNLILFSVPDVFRLFEGLLKLILGIIFFFVTVCFFIGTMFAILPFNLLLPTYSATFYN